MYDNNINKWKLGDKRKLLFTIECQLMDIEVMTELERIPFDDHNRDNCFRQELLAYAKVSEMWWKDEVIYIFYSILPQTPY